MINFKLESQSFNIKCNYNKYNLWVHVDHSIILTHYSYVSYRLFSNTAELYNLTSSLELKTIIKCKGRKK